MRRAVTALRLLQQAAQTPAARDAPTAVYTSLRRCSHEQASVSGRTCTYSALYSTVSGSAGRGFASDAAAPAQSQQLPSKKQSVYKFPSLGRAALPGRGQGSVNVALEEAPPQYTVLPDPITERYPKVYSGMSPCAFHVHSRPGLLLAALVYAI